jgi:hypothetical protein
MQWFFFALNAIKFKLEHKTFVYMSNFEDI